MALKENEVDVENNLEHALNFEESRIKYTSKNKIENYTW